MATELEMAAGLGRLAALDNSRHNFDPAKCSTNPFKPGCDWVEAWDAAYSERKAEMEKTWMIEALDKDLGWSMVSSHFRTQMIAEDYARRHYSHLQWRVVEDTDA